jgi:hypothetical protein
MNFNQISDDAACKFVDSRAGSIYEGEILGKDNSGGDEFVWALVHDLKSVFQFHPSNAAVDGNGNVVFTVYDRKMSINKVANQQPDDGTTPMFWYAQNPDVMLRKVKMFNLVLP